MRRGDRCLAARGAATRPSTTTSTRGILMHDAELQRHRAVATRLLPDFMGAGE
jgi:hypothetical protein